MQGHICVKSLLGLSLYILLMTIEISDSRPLQTSSKPPTEQPAFCNEARPRSSADSLCKTQVVRYLLHSKNPRGCKKFGICSEDSAIHDNLTNENYFITYEECQRTCMQYTTCPEPATLDDNVILVSDNNLTGWGEKLVYKCGDGYSLSDNPERQCQKNGTWSGSPPVCLEQCTPPSNIKYGHSAPSKDYHNQGAMVHYTCNVGYRLEGSPTRTCGDNGTWSGQEPRCVCQIASDDDECLSCPEPSPLNHGNVMAPNRSMGSVLEYMCKPGFIMIGDPKRECTSQGKWSGVEPICWRLELERHEYENNIKMNISTVTNTSIIASSATSYSMKILIISSYPNPFQDEIQEWTFTKDGAVEEELPEAIEVGGNRLTFTHIYASREQEGIYTLTLGNYTVWFELEASVPNQMFEAPKIVISPTLRSNIVNGGRVILSCAMEGCPAPMMSWYHDGVELHSDARRVISMVKDHVLAVGSLEINSVREEDGGEYWCSGSNGVGPDVVSDNITLNVPPPQGDHSISKRSVEEIKDSLCDSTSPDTVVLIGQVTRRKRNPSSMTATYHIDVNRLVRGAVPNDMDPATNNLRTIVLDSGGLDAANERLSKNTDYIFRGRFLMNKTFVVSKQDIHRHASELENHINTC